MASQVFIFMVTILIIITLPSDEVDAVSMPLQELYDGPFNVSCTLDITEKSLAGLGSLLSQGPYIIYIDVTFGWFVNGEWYTYKPYYDHYEPFNDMQPVQPFMFTLLFGSKGETLGALPSIFRLLSLFTLSPGVFNMEMQIDFNPQSPSSSCSNFIHFDDTSNPPYQTTSDTINIIVNKIFNVTQQMTALLTPETQIPSTTQPTLSFVCQETYNQRVLYSAAIGNTFNILYEQSEVSCGNPVQYWTKSWKTSTLRDTVYLTIIPLFIFCPLALLILFQRKNPPKLQGNQILISHDTDLPVGVKYFIFYWTPKGFLGFMVTSIRVCMLFAIGIMILYPDLFTFSVLDNQYDQRMYILTSPILPWLDNSSCAYHVKSGVIKMESLVFLSNYLTYSTCFESYLHLGWLTTIPIALEILIFFVLGSILKSQLIEKGLQILFEEDEHERAHLLPWVSLPIHLQIPKHEDNLPRGFGTLLYYSSWRINLILNHKLWLFLLWKIKEDIRTSFCKIPFLWHLMFVGLFGQILILYILIAIVFNLLPTTYMIYRLLKMSKMFHSKPAKVLFFLFQLLVTIILGYRIEAFVYLVGAMTVLTFTGLIMNASVVNSIFILIISLAGYVAKSLLDIYDSYYQLLLMIIKNARKIDDFVANCCQENMPKMGQLTYKLKQTDDIRIDMKLFWFVVERCHPLRMKVAGTLVKIVCAILTVYPGIKILSWTHQLQKMNDISVTLATVLAVMVTPKVIEYVKSNATINQDKHMFEKKVKKAIIDYRTELLFQDSDV